MAATTIGQPSSMEVGLPNMPNDHNKPTYANILSTHAQKTKSLPLKPIMYLHGEPKSETTYTKQCKLKGEVNIGLLSNKYILIRASLLEDYVTLLSKPQFDITHNY
ncbi:hypothetical protein H5410_001845 [Solanum commersonii]|uniref:Uncharacterized protein n=1 Tax=Solanum commersonii TaxID=4109 RepID=A0A9J6B082_SOLCO|nr:hypothetical protein H5410_001845 [Solanum commersonii]